DRDSLEPGQNANIQLILQESAAVWPGDRFVIRSYSPAATIGGGMILGCAPPKRKRTAERDRQRSCEVFAVYKSGELTEKILLLLEESGLQGLAVDQLAARLGLFGKRLKKQLEQPVSAKKILVVETDSQRLLAASVADKLGQAILALLKQYHQANPLKNGLATEEIRSRLKLPADQKLFQYMISSLSKQGQIVQEGAEVRLVGHQVTLQVDEQEVQEKISRVYQQAGLEPPLLKEVLAQFAEFREKQIQQVMELLLRQTMLVKVSETLIFHKDALNILAEKMTTFMLKEGEIDAPRFKDLTGLSRKFSIPLLEYFDKIKLTIRVGDKRVLRKR
ncbi:SelB C-terminal domain-containing protein, partial [Desulfobulbus sp. F4]|nr:SelB C-terminal domain-containing protein [Desulfobulbus sp. F4]